jgi:type IV secretion system protein TrbF
MIFRQSTQRYGRTPAPVTPYQRAAQEWDVRIGSVRVQARNWRLMALGQLLLSSGLAVALIWSQARGGIVPYVVEVDRLGETRAVGPAIERYAPKDAEIAWHLARFISNVRSLSFDPVLVRRSGSKLTTTPRARRRVSSTNSRTPAIPSLRSETGPSLWM